MNFGGMAAKVAAGRKGGGVFCGRTEVEGAGRKRERERTEGGDEHRRNKEYEEASFSRSLVSVNWVESITQTEGLDAVIARTYGRQRDVLSCQEKGLPSPRHE